MTDDIQRQLLAICVEAVSVACQDVERRAKSKAPVSRERIRAKDEGYKVKVREPSEMSQARTREADRKSVV